MRKRDLLWILALPVYYWINFFRHEMSHAVSAFLEGAQGVAVSLLPDVFGKSGLPWGEALLPGQATWITSFMPYLGDLLTYLIFFYICMAVSFQRRWIWINLVVIGLVTPLLNSGVNYILVSADIRNLMQVFSPLSVDLYFVATIAFYITGLVLVFAFSRTTLPSTPETNPI